MLVQFVLKNKIFEVCVCVCGCMQGETYVQGLCVVASSEFIYCLLWVSFHYLLVKWVPAHYCNGVTEQEKSDLSSSLCVLFILLFFVSLSSSFHQHPPPQASLSPFSSSNDLMLLMAS